MSVPQSPVITPAAAWENAGRGRLTTPRVTTKPAMWSIINGLAKRDVPYSRFAKLADLLQQGRLENRVARASPARSLQVARPSWPWPTAEIPTPVRDGAVVLRAARRGANPNKPMRAKVFAINKIVHKAGKQTHGHYPPWYQSLRAILAPIFKKNEWNYERSCDVL